MGNLVVEVGCVLLEGGTLTSTTKAGVPIFCVGVITKAVEEHISSGKEYIIPYGSGWVYVVVTSCIELIQVEI